MVFTNVVNQLDASYTQRVVRFEKSQVYWRKRPGYRSRLLYEGYCSESVRLSFLEIHINLKSHTSSRAATLHQFTLDSLDIWIPATGLGLTNLNDGVLGIFG